MSQTAAKPQTLTGFFEQVYAGGPDRLAFRIRTAGGTTEVSYRTLFRQAEQFAGRYAASGVTAGRTVLIILDHSTDLLSAFVGAVLIGAVPAILPPPSPRQDPAVFWAQLAEMTRLTGRTPVVAAGALFDALPQASPLREYPLLSLSGLDSEAAPGVWNRPAPDDVAFLQYSSGTTGLRKGVIITHRMFCAQLASYRRVLRPEADDRVASWLPLYHDMGLLACFLQPLAMGMPASLIDPFAWVSRPDSFLAEVEDFRATYAWMPNFAFNHLVHTAASRVPRDLGHVKAFINCSEPCKPETFERFLDAFGTWGVRTEMLQTCYAMAEAVFAVTQSVLGLPVTARSVPGEPRLGVLSVGRVLPDLELRIVDDRARLCPDEVVGEIELRGTMVTTGYFNNPDATEAVFRDGWYRTGDLGFLFDGELYITGRKKELLIINGRNYYAHDVEAIVAGLPEIKPGRAVAFGNPNAETGSDELIVVAEPRTGAANGDQAATRRKAKAAVAEVLGVTISTVALVPPGWIVKTTSGKVDRENNRRKFLEILT